MVAMRHRGGFSFNFGPHVKSEASRAATYNKRKRGLLKKVKELSILCGVECAVMCHHPQMTGSPPLLWGSPDVDSVLNRFKGVAPEERQKRKLDNTGLLHTHLQKLYDDLSKVAQENQGKALVRMTPWDERLEEYSATDLYRIADEVLRKKQEVETLLASVTTVTGVPQNDCSHLVQGYPVTQRAPFSRDPGIQTLGSPSSSFMLQVPHHNEGNQLMQGYPEIQRAPYPDERVIQAPGSPSSDFMLHASHHNDCNQLMQGFHGIQRAPSRAPNSNEPVIPSPGGPSSNFMLQAPIPNDAVPGQDLRPFHSSGSAFLAVNMGATQSPIPVNMDMLVAPAEVESEGSPIHVNMGGTQSPITVNMGKLAAPAEVQSGSSPIHVSMGMLADLAELESGGSPITVNLDLLAGPADVEFGGTEECISSEAEQQNADPEMLVSDAEYQAIFGAIDELGFIGPTDMASAFPSMSSFNFDSILQGRTPEWWEVGTPSLVPHVT